MRIGALEAGGTKMVCAVGDENGQILEIFLSIPLFQLQIKLCSILRCKMLI